MRDMRILAVFSHPDDELGCVGTLSKHAKRGDDVMLVWTTYGELASHFVDAGAEDVRRIRHEHGRHVALRLGAEYRFFDMGDSRIKADREEKLELARFYAKFKPDVVITWSDAHAHPDHQATSRIAVDAVTFARIPKIINERSAEQLTPHRKPVRVYQYADPSCNRPVVHVDITGEIDLAVELFAFYQGFYGWEYSPEQFRANRATFGRECGVKFAEKLQVRGAFAPAVQYLGA